MSEVTERYALPLLQVAQAQKEVTHNEAVAAIDTLLHLAVETATLAVPPPAPVTGQAWIVATGATGVWAGRDGSIASFDSAGWHFLTPRQGCTAWLRDTQRFAVHTAAGWQDDAWPAAGIRIGTRTALSGTIATVTEPAGGVVVDAELRATVDALLAALRTQGVVA